MTSFRITYSLFYIVGLIYTSFCIYKNVRQYLRHESDIVVTEYENGKIESKNRFFLRSTEFLDHCFLEDGNHQVENSFPEIILCSDSMHSRSKIQKKYPMLELPGDIETLYGVGIDQFEVNLRVLVKRSKIIFIFFPQLSLLSNPRL